MSQLLSCQWSCQVVCAKSVVISLFKSVSEVFDKSCCRKSYDKSVVRGVILSQLSEVLFISLLSEVLCQATVIRFLMICQLSEVFNKSVFRSLMISLFSPISYDKCLIKGFMHDAIFF